MAYSPVKTNGNDWSNLQFVVPSGVQSGVLFDLAVSDTIANNSDAENMDVTVKIDAMDPGQAVNNTAPSYINHIIVEEEVSPGVWDAIAESFGRNFNDLSTGEYQVKFIIQTKNTTDPGQPFSVLGGVKYYVNENPSEKLRIRVCTRENNPGGVASLNSINLTASYRLY